MTRGTRARSVSGLALVAAGLLATAGGVVATVTDATTSGSVALESAVVPSTPTASIGDQVFEDRDRDGRRGPSEPGLAGVTVTLLDAAGRPAVTVDGTPVAPQVTDAEGHYTFARLTPGTYRVGVTDLPDAARFSPASGEPAVDDDSDVDPATGVTEPIDLTAGERNVTIDAGVFVAAPGLAIETRAQGLDADAAPGPTVPEGTEVGFDYLVTNIGNEPLVDLVVADDQGVTVTCGQTTVAVGQTVACSGRSITTVGGHRNVGVARAAGVGSAREVTAEDPTHHTVAATGLVVDKRVDGVDADVATDAIETDAGAPVTYTFTVTNVGTEPVVDITLEDVGLGAVTCPAPVLGPGEDMDCEPRTVPAPAGLSTNVAVARGRAADSSTALAATDAANVFGRDTRVVLHKEAYDPARRAYLDGDADPGSPGSNDGAAALLESGATARYRLQLVNTGNVDLPDASVVDDGCDDPPEVIFGDHGVAGVLEVGEAWTLRCERGGVTDPYTNTAEATASGVAATERARVEPVDGHGAVAVEKLVRGPGGSQFGPSAEVAAGEVATFRIQVTNVGTRSLVDLVVRDPLLSGCDHEVAGPLAPGETTDPVLCTTEPLSAGFTNEATAAAAPIGSGDTVIDTATAQVTVSGVDQTDLSLTKALLRRSGDVVRWELTVRNLGPGLARPPLTVVDHLPSGLLFAGATGAGWSCAASGQEVRCDGPELAEGASSRVVLSTRLAPGTTGVLRNTARLEGADGNGANDEGAAVVRVTTSTPTTTTPTTATPTTAPPTGVVPPSSGPGSGDERPGGAGGRLPSTGADVLGLWVTGLSLVVLGLLLLWSGRRRRRAVATRAPDPPSRDLPSRIRLPRPSKGP